MKTLEMMTWTLGGGMGGPGFDPGQVIGDYFSNDHL
ncbi:hypothetical protein PIIN_11379 [Serendipita indica DSM 11827]|uniref:Uncharacterized protein n=1 Tax=Serendipita indica (strain DSM 11827) TaxID=1109443 RepID=G4U1F9_SERID|nr:hypothetical protein PIIN_11379 [Serendipita indica DSM 11827]